MQLFTDGTGELIMTGQKCWVDMPKRMEFAGDVMYAEVIEGHREPQEGHIFVRQLATPAMPFPGEEGGWVSEQPLSQVQGG